MLCLAPTSELVEDGSVEPLGWGDGTIADDLAGGFWDEDGVDDEVQPANLNSCQKKPAN